MHNDSPRKDKKGRKRTNTSCHCWQGNIPLTEIEHAALTPAATEKGPQVTLRTLWQIIPRGERSYIAAADFAASGAD